MAKLFQYQGKTEAPPTIAADIAAAAAAAMLLFSVNTTVVYSKTIIYQDIADVPFNPTESITTDKWFNPLSVPARLAKPRTVEYPSFAIGTPPIVNTADQWWKNFDTPPKAKPRSAEYPSFTIGSPPEIRELGFTVDSGQIFSRAFIYQDDAYAPFVASEEVTVDKWYRDLDKPRSLTQPRTAEYRAFTYGHAPIVNATDQWWQNFATPPKAKPCTAEYQAFIYDYPSAAEVITVDKWYEPLSEPKVKVKLRSADYPAFTYGATPIVNTADQWWQNLATPPKAKPRSAEYPYLAFQQPPFQASDNIGWHRPLSEPRKLTKERAADFPAFFYGADPIVSNVDRWWQNLATPPKAKARTVDYNAAFTPPYQLTASDFTVGWFRQLSEPYPSKRGLGTHQHQAVAFLPGGVLETITVDKWFNPFIDPNKLSKARATDFPAFVYGPTPIVSTVDRWWRDLATPPKARPRASEYPFTAFTPVQPQARDQVAWHRPFSEPVRLRGLNTALQPGYFTAQVVTAEVVTQDKWFVQWTQPKRDRFGQLYYEQQSSVVPERLPEIQVVQFSADTGQIFTRTFIYPDYAYTAVVTPEIVTLDKWFNPFAQPRRLAFGQLYYRQLASFPNPFPVATVVRVVARGYIIC